MFPFDFIGSVLIAPWFLPLACVVAAIWFVLSQFDPIQHRNSQPQNTSHYQLPYNDKPSKSINNDDMMYFYASATELGRFLREKRITATVLLKKYIDRLTHVNVSINAAINYRFSQAIDEAIICDDVIHQLSIIHANLAKAAVGTQSTLDLTSYNFEDYPILASLDIRTDSITLTSANETLPQFLSRYLPPFFGVPCTTKECFALRGMPHTSGLVSRRNMLADYTSPVILNMQRSGLIIFATTNTSELCMWMESQNLVYGQTRNPYSLKRTPGGSSGGEGALLGSLSTPLSLGSDVGGSIRMPAFFNGIYGHKPTSSYVSGLGQVPSARGGIPDFFCQAGPMARYPADLWPLLQVLVQTQHNGDPDAEKGDRGRSVLNLNSESGLYGEKRRINLMPRPSISLADVASVKNEYSTTLEGKTIVDQTAKHYHNKHGIAAKYDQTVSSNSASASDDMVFAPYPHLDTKYFNFNSLLSSTAGNYPILTSSHPNQIYYKDDAFSPTFLSQLQANTTQISTTTTPPPTYPKIHQITPYQVDCSQVVVYNLKDFGTMFPPVSRVDPILIHQQHEVAQFYANMGCSVYEIDVDKLIAFYKAVAKGGPNEIVDTGVLKLQKNPNFFIPIPGTPILTDQLVAQPVPEPVHIDPRTMPKLEVFRGFVEAFEHWSSGMTLTLSAFRELLLQDCTVEAMANVELGKKKMKLQAQNEQVQMAHTSSPSLSQSTAAPLQESSTDSAHSPYGDWTSCEELSKYSTLSQEVVDDLDPFQKGLYKVLLVLSTIFHSIRRFLIKAALPLEGIPHIGNGEAKVEIKRQKDLQVYLKQQRAALLSNQPQSLPVPETPLPTPSMHDIHPPMELADIVTPSMPLLTRIYFEIRVAVYIIYHICLSCCSRQLIPTGTRCLAETQGETCWHDTRPLPGSLPTAPDNEEDNTDLTTTHGFMVTDAQASSRNAKGMKNPTILGRVHSRTSLGRSLSRLNQNQAISSSHLNMTPKVLTHMISLKGGLNGFGNAIALPATSSQAPPPRPVHKNQPTIRRKKKLYDPNAPTDDEDDGDCGEFESDDDGYYSDDDTSDTYSEDNNAPISSDPFIATIYPLYLQHKAQYSYCNCTRVLQSSKQVMLMTRKQNHVTIANIFSSFLPMTPYTFPALLLGLIDRVGDLTPAATLTSFAKSCAFSQKLNNLLAPSPTQPFGAVILAPPHPVQAPGHFAPVRKPFNFVYTGIFNATLTPVTSVPTGLYKNLPTGIQVVGARHCDVTTIAMALLAHEQWGGWQPMKRLHSKYHISDGKGNNY